MLRGVPDEQFNMGLWWLADGMAFDDDRNRMYKVADGPCGCVVGHMIQKGLLPGGVLGETGRFPGVDDAFRRIDVEMKIFNTQVTRFLFDQYAYPSRVYGGAISKEQVLGRIEFVISELEAVQ
jgi:hypothetical protein